MRHTVYVDCRIKVNTILPTVHLQHTFLHPNPLPHNSFLRYICRAKKFHYQQEDWSGDGDLTGHSRVYLRYKVDDRGTEKKSEHLDHGRDNFNYSQYIRYSVLRVSKHPLREETFR